MKREEDWHLVTVEFDCRREQWRDLARTIRDEVRKECEQFVVSSTRVVIVAKDEHEHEHGIRTYNWSALVEPFGTPERTRRRVAKRLYQIGLLMEPNDVWIRQ